MAEKKTATKTTVKKVEEAAKISIISEPRATEKSYSEQAKRTYVFGVKRNASKQVIAKAVEEEYKVTVTSVRVLTRKGKKTRFSRGKHAYPGVTYRQDKKYAYVTLKEGDKIRVEAFEKAEKEAVANAKAEAKAEAETKKSAKTEDKAKKSEEKKGDKK